MKDRRIGVVGGRLVTDANGAPCCCDPVPCPCDLSNATPRSRIACNPYRVVPILGGALFGAIYMEVRWRIVAEYGGPSFARLTGDGLGLLCSQADGLPPLVLPGSYSRSTYTTPTASQTIEGGPEAWNRAASDGGTGGRTVVSVTGALVSTGTVPVGLLPLTAAPDALGERCVWSEAPTGAGFSRSVDYADADEGGRAIGTAATFAPRADGSGEMVVEWTRSLTCRVGGSGLLPPGIDPATLRPIQPCVGCGA